MSPPARPASSTVAVIAPGPAISGIASGNAAMSRTCSSTALPAVSDWRVMRTPNAISLAIENNSSPPAMRNAGSEIESVRNSQSPASAAPVRIAKAIRAGADRDAAPGCRWQAGGDAEEGRDEADRIDHDQQRHQRRNQEIDRHFLVSDGAESAHSKRITDTMQRGGRRRLQCAS